MNPILIVLPILTLLMFDLGLTLRPADFLLFRRRPRAVAVGLVGQIVVLPAVAFALGMAFALPPVFFVGLVLIACSPGGSSSNIFSKLAGVFVRHRFPSAAASIDRVLARVAFPALILLAVLFFIQHRVTIMAHFTGLGACITLMILTAVASGAALSRLMHLERRETRTVVIEVGMQNAAQAIAVASSPLIFHNDVMAIPAILYALLMNVILLIYVAAVKRRG